MASPTRELVPPYVQSTVAPDSADSLATAVRDCYANGTPVYPVGGGTSLAYGLTPKMPGVGLSLAALNRVIDYPARDMTITVEAGITMGELAATLAKEKQQLPIDVPQAGAATLGGAIATNWNGPRRYGLGTVRDYVIGISAVDGRGMAFKGGGRVVKNVAGYDFCKLLTGSLGTIGVITQATLKVRPLAEKSVLMVAALPDANQLETALTAISGSQTTPNMIDVVSGQDWTGHPVLADIQARSPAGFYVVIGLEGTRHEVDWMAGQLVQEWREAGITASLSTLQPASLLPQLIDWPADDTAPLVLKANVLPSGVVRLVQTARELDPRCSILSHAGSGVVYLKLAEFPASGLSRMLIGKLQPAAAKLGGHVVVLSNPSGAESTLQSVWGGNEGTIELMRAVKRNFDPKGILNPGRFVI
jgi:glycolate oxidase FAD binding subunit